MPVNICKGEVRAWAGRYLCMIDISNIIQNCGKRYVLGSCIDMVNMVVSF